jgi:hypothetical protein
MLWRNKEKEAERRERERFYLLPGMGGRAYRRKRKIILQCAIGAGLLASALVALAFYLINRPGK